jgi:hypothetical protein
VFLKQENWVCLRQLLCSNLWQHTEWFRGSHESSSPAWYKLLWAAFARIFKMFQKIHHSVKTSHDNCIRSKPERSKLQILTAELHMYGSPLVQCLLVLRNDARFSTA